MEFKAEFVAVKTRFHAIEEGRIRTKSRHFLFVFVGHQLEQVARDRLGQAALTGRFLSLHRAYFFHPVAVTACVARILVSREKFGATVDGLGEGLRRSEEHTSELQSRRDLVCRLLLEKKKKTNQQALS